MTAGLETLVRSRDPETSYDAAARVDPEQANLIEGWILLTLSREPLADFELESGADLWHVTPQRIRTIRAALTRAGLVDWNGGYHRTSRNRLARVWQVSS